MKTRTATEYGPVVYSGNVLFLLLLQLAAADARGPAVFKARVAAFDARARELADARSGEARGKAALAWLEALRQVLSAIPIERTDNPIFKIWLDGHDELVAYSEPAGAWYVRHEVIWKLHDQHRTSVAADEIAWIGAMTGIPGECEGYIPCYAFGLNNREGEYLRRHPAGRHKGDALEEISKTINVSVDDLLSRPDRNDFLKVPDDCGDLLTSLMPLRESVSAVSDPAVSSALIAIDRLRGYCRR
jgi:hypothetical protein